MNEKKAAVILAAEKAVRNAESLAINVFVLRAESTSESTERERVL